jgi:hypothetical protein
MVKAAVKFKILRDIPVCKIGDRLPLCTREKAVFNYLYISTRQANLYYHFFFFDATVPIWALTYLHETLCFTSLF